MTPTVGRIIHVFADGEEHPRAGIVIGLQCQGEGIAPLVNAQTWSETGKQVTFLGIKQRGAERSPLDAFSSASWDWPPRA